MTERRPLSDPAVQQALGRKRQKYNAKRTEVDGIMFDSAKEARRYSELKLLLDAGEIRNLRVQPEYHLCVPDHNWNTSVGVNGNASIGLYRADFEYFDFKARTVVTEDVKGYRTALYRWKKKHVEAQYGIHIREL